MDKLCLTLNKEYLHMFFSLALQLDKNDNIFWPRIKREHFGENEERKSPVLRSHNHVIRKDTKRYEKIRKDTQVSHYLADSMFNFQLTI